MLRHRIMRYLGSKLEDLGIESKREDPSIGDVIWQQVTRPTKVLVLQAPCSYVTPTDAMYKTHVNGRIVWTVQLKQTKGV